MAKIKESRHYKNINEVVSKYKNENIFESVDEFNTYINNKNTKAIKLIKDYDSELDEKKKEYKKLWNCSELTDRSKDSSLANLISQKTVLLLQIKHQYSQLNSILSSLTLKLKPRKFSLPKISQNSANKNSPFKILSKKINEIYCQIKVMMPKEMERFDNKSSVSVEKMDDILMKMTGVEVCYSLIIERIMSLISTNKKLYFFILNLLIYIITHIIKY